MSAHLRHPWLSKRCARRHLAVRELLESIVDWPLMPAGHTGWWLVLVWLLLGLLLLLHLLLLLFWLLHGSRWSLLDCPWLLAVDGQSL